MTVHPLEDGTYTVLVGAPRGDVDASPFGTLPADPGVIEIGEAALAFRSAPQAVRCAVALQEAQPAPSQLAAGLHAGDARPAGAGAGVAAGARAGRGGSRAALRRGTRGEPAGARRRCTCTARKGRERSSRRDCRSASRDARSGSAGRLWQSRRKLRALRVGPTRGDDCRLIRPGGGLDDNRRRALGPTPQCPPFTNAGDAHAVSGPAGTPRRPAPGRRGGRCRRAGAARRPAARAARRAPPPRG